MTPADFLGHVVAPNVDALSADVGDVRLAVNAILTLDALAGIIHDDLVSRGRETGEDEAFRDRLAEQHVDYRILRDTAAAIKHGELRHKKPRLPRLVKRADQVRSYSPVWGEAVWDRSAHGIDVIWVEAEDPSNARRVDEIARAVQDILREMV